MTVSYRHSKLRFYSFMCMFSRIASVNMQISAMPLICVLYFCSANYQAYFEYSARRKEN